MSNDSRRILIRGSVGTFGEPIGTLVPTTGLEKGGVIQWVQITDNEGNPVISNAGDGKSGTTPGLNTQSLGYLYNGSTFDRERSNTEEALLSAAARTTTTDSIDFTNWNAKGLHVIISVYFITNTPSIVPFIQGRDPISGDYYDILEGLPITTIGTNIIKVFPGISAVVNVSASDILPRTYRVRVEHANADSLTYSVAGALVI